MEEQNGEIAVETIAPEVGENQAGAQSQGEAQAEAGGEPKETLESKIKKASEKLSADADPAKPATETPAFTANTKYKVMDKEHEIPKEFHGLMKDADSEKKVKELFERSTGLDVVKQNLQTVRTERNQFAQENAEIKHSIGDLRTTYQAAVKSGDYHKLDSFFEKLEIPQDVILKYAHAKVQMFEMPEEQRQALLAKQEAEKRAEQFQREQAQNQTGSMQMQAQLIQLQMEHAFTKPDTKAISEDYDARVGKQGAFRELVRLHGENAYWSKKVTLAPEQAIAEVVQNMGLTVPQPKLEPQAQQTTVVPKKPTTKVIPNLGGGGSASPLKSKPKSIDDIKELAKRAAQGEAI